MKCLERWINTLLVLFFSQNLVTTKTVLIWCQPYTLMKNLDESLKVLFHTFSLVSNVNYTERHIHHFAYITFTMWYFSINIFMSLTVLIHDIYFYHIAHSYLDDDIFVSYLWYDIKNHWFMNVFEVSNEDKSHLGNSLLYYWLTQCC